MFGHLPEAVGPGGGLVAGPRRPSVCRDAQRLGFLNPPHRASTGTLGVMLDIQALQKEIQDRT